MYLSRYLTKLLVTFDFSSKEGRTFGRLNPPPSLIASFLNLRLPDEVRRRRDGVTARSFKLGTGVREGSILFARFSCILSRSL